MTSTKVATTVEELVGAILASDEDITASDLASKLCDNEPRAVAEWLERHKVVLLSGWISDRKRSANGGRAKMRSRSVFADALEAGPEAVAGWRNFMSARFAVDDTDTQRVVGRMSKPDLMYVATGFQARAKENALMEAVFRAIARKVPHGKEVRDVFTEEEIDALVARMLGR